MLMKDYDRTTEETSDTRGTVQPTNEFLGKFHIPHVIKIYLNKIMSY